MIGLSSACVFEAWKSLSTPCLFPRCVLSSRTSRQVYVTIEEPFQGELSPDWVSLVTTAAMSQALSPGREAQVAVLITGDETVRQLNRDYRGVDEVTDVLSFSAEHSGPWQGDSPPLGDWFPEQGNPGESFEFMLPPGELPPLGEVVVSYPQTRRQALERQPLEPDAVGRELALLLVHGVLHLVGYDHGESAETARMQARERAALASLNPYGDAGTGLK